MVSFKELLSSLCTVESMMNLGLMHMLNHFICLITFMSYNFKYLLYEPSNRKIIMATYPPCKSIKANISPMLTLCLFKEMKCYS